MCIEQFYAKGWCRIAEDPRLARWAARVLPAARAVIADPAQAEWWRCDGTWFAGINVLPNDGTGAVADSGPLCGAAMDFVRAQFGPHPLDTGQISVCYPGYPRQGRDESMARWQFRQMRDAAHVDGILRDADGRRRLREHHAYIFGIPLTVFSPTASPFVLWEGSHIIMRAALTRHLADLPPAHWPHQDLTDLYHQTRHQIFTQCRRVPITATYGSAFVVHRLTVHGTAPWAADAVASADGRMICYFRPPLPDPQQWLTAR